jgi:ABC-2 type transport system ATP-binding protein
VSADLIIDARNLSRQFTQRGKVTDAVRGISFGVPRGSIVGFLGPNGAGKSTTLKMLCTLLRPTGGNATVAGCDLAADPEGVRRRIGYVAQGGTTARDCTVGLEITTQGRLYGLSTAEARRRGEGLLEALDLPDVWTRTCGALSGGQRRRLDIVLGLIHQPDLIFLDEPSTGLDPQSRANLWTHIRALRDTHGTTVFLTTHYLDEADALSDTLLIIDKGGIVGQGTSAALKAEVSGDAIALSLRAADQVAGTLDIAKAQGGVHIVAEGTSVRFQVPQAATALPHLLRDLSAAGIDPIGVETAKPTLDDVFLSLTGRSLRD